MCLGVHGALTKRVQNMRAQRKETIDKLAHGLASAFTAKKRRSVSSDELSSPLTPAVPLSPAMPSSPKTRRPLCAALKRRSTSSSDGHLESHTTLASETSSPRKLSEETLVEEPAELSDPALPELPADAAIVAIVAPQQRQQELSNQTLAVVALVLAVSQVSICLLAHLKAAGL